MQHKNIFGRIAYTSKKPEMMDKPRGYESFHVTKHSDGKKTIRAHCEIEEPTPTVMRDIIYSCDKNYDPMDCHVRLTVGDEFMGSGWFYFKDGKIECESFGPSTGRLSQVRDTEGAYDLFGTHPIVADAFNCRALDTSNGPTKRNMRCFVPSPDHRGATPPMVAEVNIDLAYLGEEEITVQAGTFQCRHFQFSDSGGGMGDHPSYDVWVTADDDYLFVCGGVGGYMQTWYELVELTRD